MPPTSVSLLERLRDRADSDAWTRMVDLYSPMVRAWLSRYELPQADVDDISQTALGSVVANLPQFHHNGRNGAFRNWLRTITVNSLRQKFRSERARPDDTSKRALVADLNELEDPESRLSKLWDRAHDAQVLRTLLVLAEPEFEAPTWQAFRALMLDGTSPKAVAAQLDMTVNAVLIAKCRVLKRLRELSCGLID
jgi:RNA polymerase sigma-70 factor, ECF subfamily